MHYVYQQYGGSNAYFKEIQTDTQVHVQIIRMIFNMNKEVNAIND